MNQNKSSAFQQSRLLNQLHIYGLFGIAVAYPLYAFLRANPAYLLINGATEGHLYAIITSLSFIFPTVLVILELELLRHSKKAYQILHHILIALLVALSFLPLISRIEALPITLNLVCVAILTTLVIHEYKTNRFTYTCLTLLVPLAFAFPIHFAKDHNISQMLHPQPANEQEVQVLKNNNLPPVVFVVFDALPLIDLLDAQGNIDHKRFPNFASMAEQSTWYPNATTVHDMTVKSIPSILTGRYPYKELTLPLPENYPGTLFDVLRGHYRINAYEEFTSLSPPPKEDRQAPKVDTKTLATDLAIFYARALLPAHTSDAWIPLEDGIWGGFLARMPDREKKTAEDLNDWRIDKVGNNKIKHRYLASKHYVNQLAQFPRNTFHYFHIILPHRPFELLPTGNLYSYSIEKELSNKDTARFEREAHILHVGLADTILGELRTELIKLKHWDDALVIVVADHGEAFQENQNKRLITLENLGEVGFVPLLIKYPHQKIGKVDNTNVQTIDIAPTVLDVLDIQNGPRVDGRSLIDQNAQIPELKTIFSNTGKTHHFTEEDYLNRRASAHEYAVDFFTLKDSRSDLFNYGPGLDYLGTQLDTWRSYAIECEINAIGQKGHRYMNFTASRLATMLKGTISMQQEMDVNEIILAISINGTIKAVTKPYYSKGNLNFHKVLSEKDFHEGKNDFNLLLLPAKAPELKQVTASPDN